MPKVNAEIRVDLGITDFAVFSSGEKKDNNTFTSNMKWELKREQRKLSGSCVKSEKRGVKLSQTKNYQKQNELLQDYTKSHEPTQWLFK